MASENKKKKLKNAYLRKNNLKNTIHKCKRLLFFTSSQRQFEKNSDEKDYLVD